MSSIPPPESDGSAGWESVANQFITVREGNVIGVDVVRAWARNLVPGSTVLDLGCGTGVPISQSLIQDGFLVYGVDASPTFIAEFDRRFPQMMSACGPVESSDFFGRSFDGVLAVGLMFLLPEEAQRRLVTKVASAMNGGGRFLFSAPRQVCQWNDTLTGRVSRSLGAAAYGAALEDAGLVVQGNYSDEGGNYYIHALKPE